MDSKCPQNLKDSHDLGRFTLEGSRPAVAIHLHANLIILGRTELRAVMDRKIAVARELAARICSLSDMDLLAHPQSDIFLCRYVPESLRNFAGSHVHAMDEVQQSLQESLKRSGKVFVSRTTVVDPRIGVPSVFLRVVINAHNTREGAFEALEELRRMGRNLSIND